MTAASGGHRPRPVVEDMWGVGDYSRVAGRLAPVADVLVSTLEPAAGSTLLDLGAGTGVLALAAARRGVRVVAADPSPSQVAKGRAAASAAGADVEWLEADATTLPLADRSIDAVASSFAVMFAPDPEAAVAGVARVLRPRGTFAVTAWPGEGPMFEVSRPLRDAHPPPADAPDITRWADETFLADLLEGPFGELRVERRLLGWPVASPASEIDELLAHSPVHLTLFRRLGDLGGEVRRAMTAELTRLLGGAGPGMIEVPYVLATARRR